MGIAVKNLRLLFVLVLFSPLSIVQGKSDDVSHRFATTAGTGPDKWGSIWLIKRYLNPHRIDVLSKPPEEGDTSITFDFPGSQFNRTGSTSTFDSLVRHFSLETEEILALGLLISEIEFQPWKTDKSVESSIMEMGFRNMQLQFGRTSVSRECYLEFFDNLILAWEEKSLSLDFDPDSLIPQKQCKTDQTAQPEDVDINVPEVSQEEILKQLAADKKIVFLDTREDEEFAEGHIPASINLKLREIDERSALGLPSADMVVAYCVKDFRGFETARKLRRYGINAVIMKPYGIKGWIDAGLPIAGPRGASEEEALETLHQIINESM